jgi:hypothetical protein
MNNYEKLVKSCYLGHRHHVEGKVNICYGRCILAKQAIFVVGWYTAMRSGNLRYLKQSDLTDVSAGISLTFTPIKQLTDEETIT